MRLWTDEAKAKHSEMMRSKIRAWSPWSKSTGPRTAEGKKCVSLNALKHGGRSHGAKKLLSYFRTHKIFLRQLNQRLKNLTKSTNKLIKTLTKNHGKCINPPANPHHFQTTFRY